MARTVALTQHGLPEWFAVGEKWAGLLAVQPPDVAARQLGLEGSKIRTAQRWARAVEFLTSTYPALLATKQHGLKAGSVAVLELARLHKLDPPTADGLAERVLSGTANTPEVRRAVAIALERRERKTTRQAPSGTAWRAAFRQLAIRRLSEHRPLLGEFGAVASVKWVDERPALKPDMVVKFVNPSYDMAVAIRGPRDTAAKSTATVAAQLLADAAVLLLRYESSPIVLPFEAERIADAVLLRWQECAKPQNRDIKRLRVMPIGATEHRAYDAPD